jgi:hypothetical protein
MSSDIDLDLEYEWSDSEIKMITVKYKRILEDSAYLLNYAVTLDTIDTYLQMSIVLLGLTAGFVTALTNIDESVRTYIGSIFSLVSSIIAGMMSIKKYGTTSGKYYGAYQDYKELSTSLNNLLIRLKTDQKYEQLNIYIARKEAKYEILFPKNRLTNEKIKTECAFLSTITEQNLNRRSLEQSEKILKEKEAKQNERCHTFIERKSYIYLHEIKLQLYKRYVETARQRDEKEIILDFENYENYFRIKHVEQYTLITDKYSEYQQRQLQMYYTDTSYNYEKIEKEIASSPLMRMPEAIFCKKIIHCFHEHLNTIKSGESSTDETVYSFDNLI